MKGLRINAFEAMGGLIPVTILETFTGTETCYQSKRGVCGEPTFIFTHYLRTTMKSTFIQTIDSSLPGASFQSLRADSIASSLMIFIVST